MTTEPAATPTASPLDPSPERRGVDVSSAKTLWGRLFAFTGPAFMVSVGYMDPGNWATDIAGGAQFGYKLLWVILLANLMAIVLQTLSARMGIALRRDLAQACRDSYSRPISLVLWVLAEIAIAACDLAEVLGSAIGLHLLFGLPILAGVVITAFDVLLLLMLQSYGIRRLEAFIVSLIATIGICFALELILSKPDLGAAAWGLVPSGVSGNALFIAIGILGATVMPHNLYLHSALVQSRNIERSPEGIQEAARFNVIDCVVAMNGAFLVNASILILAASTFHATGKHDVQTLQEAHSLLSGILGTKVAPVAFAIALLAAGQSSTITGTLAGQIIMEGFVDIRMKPWLRRLITRLLAIGPAVAVILWKGDQGVDSLLILSQVILSLQLSFAVVPLIHFTGDPQLMGHLASPRWLHVLAWICAAIILTLNGKLVWETIAAGWSAPGIEGFLTRWMLFPLSCALLPLLGWMIVEYRLKRMRERLSNAPEILPAAQAVEAVAAGFASVEYKKIVVALEAVVQDREILAAAIPLARPGRSELILVHVVESGIGRFLGTTVDDEEARSDAEYLRRITDELDRIGLNTAIRIGAGEASEELARIAGEEQADLIVTGSHGHSFLQELVTGSTIDELRRRTTIPVHSVRISGRTPLNRV